jgi:glycosyltransferase involved in cell wall biosynthesis
MYYGLLPADPAPPCTVSLGLIAWNEEASIGAALESVFAQTLFAELARRGLRAEVVCVANGCSDGTLSRASAVLARMAAEHPQRRAFVVRVEDLAERGKLGAWNRFVHRFSSPEAALLILMDADIALAEPETLWHLVAGLAGTPAASVAVGSPAKGIAAPARPGPLQRLSLAASRLPRGAPAQLTGQLYCIRAAVARQIHFPRDLPACEDGFIKAAVCTDFFTHVARPDRILRVDGASHVFAACASPREVILNQRWQMIGQAFVHVLVDKFLPTRPPEERRRLGGTLARLDADDPGWLERLMAEHLRDTRHWWRLVPGALTWRWRQLGALHGGEWWRHLPVALASWVVALVACQLAWRALQDRADRKAWGPHTVQRARA